MAQYDLNLRDYQRILRRRWKVVIASIVLVTAFSYYFGKSREPLYQTYSSVKIEETSTVSGLLMQRLTYSRWDNIATAQELIRSFPIMEKVARRMELIPDSLTSEDVQKDPLLSSKINSMINKVITERSGKTNIIDIIVISTDPHEARDIAQNLAEVFTEEHQSQRSRQDRETREFIEEQLNKSKATLRTAELELKDFREDNPGPVLDEHVRIRIEELIDLKKEQRRLDQDIQGLEVQFNELVDRLGDPSEKMARTNIDTKGLWGGGMGAALDTGEAAGPVIDWISSPQGEGPLGLLNRQILELELQRHGLLERYRPDYPAVKDLDKKIHDLVLELRREVEGNLNVMKGRRDSLMAYIYKSEAVLDSVPDNHRRYAQLLREVNLREDDYAFLTQKYQEAKIQEADQADEVSIVRPALINAKPININITRTISVGFVIGLMLGLVLAFFFETFDTSIGTIEDVEEYLQVPVLGVIPHINIEEVMERLVKKNKSLQDSPNLEANARLVTQFAPKDPVAEAYRTLRTTLQFRSISHPVKSIVATSAALQEGKSTTLVNLAITIAQDGSRVLLVGCNMRRPTLFKVFGLEHKKGVTDIVMGREPWQNCVKGVTDIIMGGMGLDPILMTPGLENLNIVTSGGVPPNPAEMLGSSNMKKFMDEVREEFDLVLFDAPPVLPVTDAAILSNHADGTLLIYRSGKVPRAALRRAKVQIESVGGTVLGVVLNDLKAEIAGYAGSHYYYGKYYGDKTRRKDEVVTKGKSPGKSGKLKDRLKSLVSQDSNKDA